MWFSLTCRCHSNLSLLFPRWNITSNYSDKFWSIKDPLITTLHLNLVSSKAVEIIVRRGTDRMRLSYVNLPKVRVNDEDISYQQKWKIWKFLLTLICNLVAIFFNVCEKLRYLNLKIIDQHRAIYAWQKDKNFSLQQLGVSHFSLCECMVHLWFSSMLVELNSYKILM